MDIQQWCEENRHTDCVIDFMLERGLPLTRETYVAQAYDTEPEWTAELEAMMPQPFRLPLNPSMQPV